MKVKRTIHNKTILLSTGWFIILFVLCSFTVFQDRPITIYLVGDSTMANKTSTEWPETGWGMPFKYFFNKSITVDNRAVNGRSTKTFIAENRWQEVLDVLKPGDYVFIEFGHNDEAVGIPRSTSPEAYRVNLEKMVRETRAKSALPILLTPVSRRRFTHDGKIDDTHILYSPIVKEVAANTHTPLIDMDKKSAALLEELGPENAKFLFNYIKPGINPNYPAGRSDDTHFNETGARRMAELVLAEIKNIDAALYARVITK
ncbi:rhamnogalacturonan acetylesterase [Pedobacter hiemivivus]|uniref:Rhamnogalacturonan acetylesterase n=1 Tax=Pedobacter hiemivivus TaxID=2530454 RepID=A0A4U1G4Q4_9SPHI|nr:rhamnogalacturonan acetylesterase [Pedobacter hiemivivus]TKC58508.1 rhamnogalacturonan acetylesterase [Pedobacter hiemivivus]